MPWHIARIDGVDCVGPPLQTDLARRRLVDHITDAGKLDIEGIERQEMRTKLLGRKQAGEKPILVALTYERKTVAFGLFFRRRASRQSGSRARRGGRLGG